MDEDEAAGADEALDPRCATLGLLAGRERAGHRGRDVGRGELTRVVQEAGGAAGQRAREAVAADTRRSASRQARVRSASSSSASALLTPSTSSASRVPVSSSAPTPAPGRPTAHRSTIPRSTPATALVSLPRTSP